MIHNIEISGSGYYYKVRPDDPRQGMIYALEVDGYIRAYVFNDEEWMLVTDMSQSSGDKVNIQCTDDTDDSSDDIEQLDYQYRIGVI